MAELASTMFHSLDHVPLSTIPGRRKNLNCTHPASQHYEGLTSLLLFAILRKERWFQLLRVVVSDGSSSRR